MNRFQAASPWGTPAPAAAHAPQRGWDYPVVIIGAGPAGSVAALRLMTLGLAAAPASGFVARDATGGAEPSVLLVDREDFPRPKVCGCCLNGAAVGALDQLGLGSLPEEIGGIPLDRWQGRIAGRRTEIPLPTGWAVSREAFDTALLGHARRAGAEVRTGVVARLLSTTEEAVTIELKDSAGTSQVVRAATVIVASGLSGGGIDHLLPWRRPPAGPIGLGAIVDAAPAGYVPGTIYMACDASGYAGLVRLEDGRLDIAAAVYEPCGESGRGGETGRGRGTRRRAGARVATILASAGMPPVPGIETVPWRGTPRLHRQREPGRGRIIAVGDAAGYVEPFTGEGMAWGMQTGLLAARVIVQSFVDQRTGALGARYTPAYDSLLARRRLACRALTAALRSAASRRMLFQMLSAAPWLARPVVWLLNRA